MTLSLNQGFWLPLGSGGGDDDDMIFISKNTVSAGTSSLEITSGIDSTYPVYKILAWNIQLNNNGAFGYQVSTDTSGHSYGQTTTSVNYDAFNYTTGASGGPALMIRGSDTNNASTNLIKIGCNSDGSTDSDSSGSLEMVISNPADTSGKFKVVDVVTAASGEGGGQYARRYITTAYIDCGTSALTAIEFKPASGTFEGVFALYGIKDS